MLIDPRINNYECFTALLEANGGIATKYYIDKYRYMTLDEFREKVAPTLKSGPSEGPFHYYVIRDLQSSRIFTLEPDGITEMHVTDLIDFPVEELRRSLEDDDTSLVDLKFNSSFPIYSYSERRDCWEMSVKTPESPVTINMDGLGRKQIYMPPCMYTVQCTKGGTVTNTKVAVIMQDSLDADLVKLAHLPFPNVYADTHICTGTSRLTETVENMPKSMIVAKSWQLLITGNFNHDLMFVADQNMPSNLSEVYKELFPDDTTTFQHAFEKLLKVLSVKGAWERLSWKAI